MRIESADYFFFFFEVEKWAQKTSDIRGQSDAHSHLLFRAISLIPIPPLHWPSNQNKIVISMWRKLCLFYWRLSDAHVIVSDLGFDRPTRERLVLQGESMVAGHITINRLPQLFLLPALWQIKCFIRSKTGGEQSGGDVKWQHEACSKYLLYKHYYFRMTAGISRRNAASLRLFPLSFTIVDKLPRNEIPSQLVRPKTRAKWFPKSNIDISKEHPWWAFLSGLL